MKTIASLSLVCLATQACAGVTLVPRQIANICRSPPANSCDFYQTCIEDRYQCGPKGYPLGFGERYCKKFGAAGPQMSAAGQEWVTKTMLCLQKALVPIASQASPTTCEDIRQVAYASHPGCYVQSGYCTLSLSDKNIISKNVDRSDSIGSAEARKATFDTLAACSKPYLDSSWQYSEIIRQRIWKFIGDLKRP
ncbi:MAG: hypothetical protein M1815_001672 [Lichina confinis]|nr:MAG: hypothetical protein M1815_001672 [Lichina confinis]